MNEAGRLFDMSSYLIVKSNRGLKEIRIKGFYNIYASQKCLQHRIESQAFIRVPTYYGI